MSLYDLLAPIRARLSEHDNPSHTPFPWDPSYFYEISTNIDSKIDTFPLSEAIPTLRLHLDWVNNLLDNLLLKVSDEVKTIPRPLKYFGEDEIHEAKYNLTSLESFQLEHLDEFEKLQKWLAALIDRREKFISDLSDIDKIQPINLPENFKLSEYKLLVNQNLTPEQAVIFIHYLVETKTIPEYSNTSIGLLTKILFGRSDDDSRKKIGNIHNLKTKKNLNKIKEIYTNVLQKIESDLETAKK